MPTSEDLPTGRMAWRVDEGDALDLLARVPADSIDAFVDDPPAGISFMDRAWDDKRAYEPRTERGHEILNGLDLLGLPRWQSGFVCFMAEVAAEKLRVAKPGAHSLSWALPRTTDLTTLALRLAGWEIRDSIVHLFGGGFPKSHDVSKALDKRAGATRDVVGSKVTGNAKQNTSSTGEFVVGHGGTQIVDITAPATELAKQWDGWGTALSPAHENWILARKPMGQTVAANVTEWGTGALNIDATRTGVEPRVNPPAGNLGGTPSLNMGVRGMPQDAASTDARGRWPKNALLSCPLACTPGMHVPWCPEDELDRQSGTRVSGAWDGKRNRPKSFGAPDNLVGDGGDEPARERSEGGASRYFPRFHNHEDAPEIGSAADIEARALRVAASMGGTLVRADGTTTTPRPRAPQPATHAAGCPVGELDRQSGVTTSQPNRSTTGTRMQSGSSGGFLSERVGDAVARGDHSDSGGASRFFPRFGYHPKASDRSVPGRPDLTNAHPTHKNPDLMRWLVRLITPPGGLVLDWCCGSGTTGVACMAEGVRFLGFERDAGHVDVARARIGAPVQVGLF